MEKENQNPSGVEEGRKDGGEDSERGVKGVDQGAHPETERDTAAMVETVIALSSSDNSDTGSVRDAIHGEKVEGNGVSGMGGEPGHGREVGKGDGESREGADSANDGETTKGSDGSVFNFSGVGTVFSGSPDQIVVGDGLLSSSRCDERGHKLPDFLLSPVRGAQGVDAGSGGQDGSYGSAITAPGKDGHHPATATNGEDQQTTCALAGAEGEEQLEPETPRGRLSFMSPSPGKLRGRPVEKRAGSRRRPAKQKPDKKRSPGATYSPNPGSETGAHLDEDREGEMGSSTEEELGNAESCHSDSPRSGDSTSLSSGNTDISVSETVPMMETDASYSPPSQEKGREPGQSEGRQTRTSSGAHVRLPAGFYREQFPGPINTSGEASEEEESTGSTSEETGEEIKESPTTGSGDSVCVVKVVKAKARSDHLRRRRLGAALRRDGRRGKGAGASSQQTGGEERVGGVENLKAEVQKLTLENRQITDSILGCEQELLRRGLDSLKSQSPHGLSVFPGLGDLGPAGGLACQERWAAACQMVAGLAGHHQSIMSQAASSSASGNAGGAVFVISHSIPPPTSTSGLHQGGVGAAAHHTGAGAVVQYEAVGTPILHLPAETTAVNSGGVGPGFRGGGREGGGAVVGMRGGGTDGVASSSYSQPAPSASFGLTGLKGSHINNVALTGKLASLVRAREEISDGRAMDTVRSVSIALPSEIPSRALTSQSQFSRSDA